VRTAYEALDVVDLLAAGEKEPAKWMFTEKGYAEFSPSAVRQSAFDRFGIQPHTGLVVADRACRTRDPLGRWMPVHR
jgi:hypothetical protein